MRLLIYARAQEAVPLYLALKMDRQDPVCLLMGGMPPEIVECEVAKFRASPAATMIATAAHSDGWRVEKEAMVIFSENSFVVSYARAANRVNEPKFAPPTADQLIAAMRNERELTDSNDMDLEEHLELPPLDDVNMSILPALCPVTHRREGDEYVCDRCALRYSADEERPACPES